MPNHPLYRRIAGDLRRSIAAGRLPRGARLPSSRALARQLGVSRNTILAAYDTLAAEGLIAGRTGSGTLVVAAPSAVAATAAAAPGAALRPDPRRFLRDAGFPLDPVSFRDADGNSLYVHR